MDSVVTECAALVDQIKVSAILTGPRQSISVELSWMNFVLFDAGTLTFWCFRSLDFHAGNPMFNAAITKRSI